MQPTRVSRLVNNTAALAVGTLTAQFVNFLILPFLTSNLSPDEYGSADLAVTLVALTGPLATLAISEAVLRFGLAREHSRAAVILTGSIVVAVGFVVSLALYPFIEARPPLADLAPLMYALLAAQLIGELSGQYLKSQDRIRVVAAAGVVYSLLVAVGNVLLVGALGWGARGNLAALVLAGLSTYGTLLGLIYIQTHPRRGDFSSALLRRMVRYSAPLMPNGVLWWLANSASRVILMTIHGPASVGLYAVAARVPTLLSLTTTVFWQAWQISAIEQRDSPTRLAFQDKVLAAMTGTLLLATSLLLAMLMPLMSILVGQDFSSAWSVVPPLLGAAIFLALATFWGTEYRVRMTTSNTLWTSALGAASAIGLNVLLVPLLGAQGGAIGTMCGYALLWLARVWDLGRLGWLPRGLWRLALGLLVLTGQSGLHHVAVCTMTQALLQVMSVCAIALLFGRPIALGLRAARAGRSAHLEADAYVAS